PAPAGSPVWHDNVSEKQIAVILSDTGNWTHLPSGPCMPRGTRSTQPFLILGGLVFGVAVGLLVDQWEISLAQQLPAVVEPIGTLWVNAIRMIVVPLLVSLLIAGIAGEHADLGAIGGRCVALF